MTAPLDLRFVLSAPGLDKLPPTPAEVALIGRSNVGKSSLVNALANRKALAKVSQRPGRTQLLNCYEVSGAGTLVDCPGYGYAVAPGSARAAWGRMVDRYLVGREELVRIVVLVDGEVGPTKLDREFLARLRADDLPLAVVATKHDKVKPSARVRRKRDLAEGCAVPPDDVIWVSAAKGTGIDVLRGRVLRWLGEDPDADEE